MIHYAYGNYIVVTTALSVESYKLLLSLGYTIRFIT